MFKCNYLTYYFVFNYSGPTTGRQDGVVAEYFAKCWLCSKGFPSPAVLREHLHSVHNESAAAIAAAMAALQPLPPSSSSSTASSSGLLLPPSLATSGPTSSGSTTTSLHHQHQQQQNSKSGAPHSCIQCNATFVERDELERHELTHSPTAQVVNYAIQFSQFPSCTLSPDSPAVQIPSIPSFPPVHFTLNDCRKPIASIQLSFLIISPPVIYTVSLQFLV